MSTSDFSKITVGVIGLGLMGGSFAKRFKEIGNRVIGINRTKSAEEEALRNHRFRRS
jgi:prephenate dehydrogenase